MRFLYQCLLLAGLLFCTTAYCFFSKINARVVKVIDGDTVDITDKDSTYRIRLYGIDAPENGQEFYAESKNFLSGLTLGKTVTLDIKGIDRYGRTIATIIRESDRVNVNVEMIRQGMAWHFTRYSKNVEWSKLESEARDKQIGLWSLFHYTEPWVYRKN